MGNFPQSASVAGPARGTVFGVRLGDLGWFASLIMAVATGFAAFFAATFCGIIGLLLVNTTGHRALDYSLSYRRIGLPFGALVLLGSLLFLGSLWVRRQLRRE